MEMHNQKCAAMHLDMWCAKSEWLQAMVSAIRSGALIPDPNKAARDYNGRGYDVTGGIAIIPLDGPLMKIWSKYGGTSTLWARAAVRNADADPNVSGIMLHIDSPGGTSAGTSDLGDDIRSVGKPIHSYISDLGASAAYWAASQTDHITIGRTGLSGSIGTYASIVDTSGAAELAGIKVHVISTGKYKGAGEEGAPVTDDQLAYWQELVNKHFAHFESAVRGGRRMTKSKFDAVSDGRVFDAADSKMLGLVDEIGSFDTAIKRLMRAK
jgi:signal peptide peptidase SppA